MVERRQCDHGTRHHRGAHDRRGRSRGVPLQHRPIWILRDHTGFGFGERGSETMVTKPEVDSVTLATVWGALRQTCYDMRHLVERTAQNYLITELHDLS